MDAHDEKNISDLPQSVQDFIKLIIKKMRYRKSVRHDVEAELTTHFEDELRDCTDPQQREQKAKELIEQFGDAKLLGILLRRAKKRCRPLWRTVVVRTFQTIGVLILSFVIYSIWFLAGKPVVTADYLSELNRMVRPVADDSQNAAPFFEKAVAAFPNLPDQREARFLWSNSYSDANDTEKQFIESLVVKSVRSLQLIEQGTQKPHYWQEYKTKDTPDNDGCLMGILIPHLGEFRKLAKVICYRAQIKAARREYSQAFDDLITCYKFGRLIGQGEKTLVEQLFGIAVQALSINNMREILAGYKLDSRQLAALQADFSKAQAGQEFRLRLLNEKLMMFDEIQRCFTDGIGGGHPYPKRLIALGMTQESDYEVSNLKIFGVLSIPENWHDAARVMFFHPNKAETKRQADVFYKFIEETSKMSPAQLREKEIDLGEQADSITQGNVFLQVMMPAVGQVHRLVYCLKTDVVATQTIIAIMRYQKTKGALPENLGQLKQAGFIEQFPIDSFSNQPLIYKRTDEGFKLYSVGLNFIDDGGRVYRDQRGIVRVWDDRGGDAVFWPVQK